MPKPLQKSLQDYLSLMKKNPTPHIHLPSRPLSSSTSWILKGCKHLKTLSFSNYQDQDHHNENNDDNTAATLSDIDRFLAENFKSLYQKKEDHDDDDKKDDDQSDEFIAFDDSPKSMDPPQDLCGSHRFFVESSSSSSLIEGARTSIEDMGSNSTSSTTTFNDHSTKPSDVVEEVIGPEDFITVLTYSKSPCDDFRRSMQEMVEARSQHHGRVDWRFMEELLFCYLNLNNKKSYKYILGAYVDMIVILRGNSGELPVRSEGEMRKKKGDVSKDLN